MRKVIFGIAAAALLAATTFSTSADARWGHRGWHGGGWWPLAAFAALPLLAGAAGAWGYGGNPYYYGGYGYAGYGAPYYAYGGPVAYRYGYRRRCGCY